MQLEKRQKNREFSPALCIFTTNPSREKDQPRCFWFFWQAKELGIVSEGDAEVVVAKISIYPQLQQIDEVVGW